MTRIAFLGLGIMGSRMAANLARAGHELTVWNRTGRAAETFGAEHGAAVAASPRAAATGATIVCSMVVDGPQVEQILLGDEGAVAGAAPGAIFVDCSTIGTAAAARIGERLARAGMRFLDAPVTGSSPRAQDGTLTFMVGGDPDVLARVHPALDAMGALIVHCGPVGSGQLVKVLNNALAAVNATALGQALVAAHRTGANVDALLRVAAAGSGGSAMLDLKAQPMLAHDYTTLFKLDHMLKDLRLCLQETTGRGAPFAFAEQAEQVLTHAQAMGYGEADFAALFEALTDDPDSI